MSFRHERIYPSTVADRERRRYFAVSLTSRQYSRLDNGCMVSIGLLVGKDITRRTLARWIKQGIAHPITFTEWNR